MPDYGHAGRPSTYLAVAGNSHRHTSRPSSSCFRLFPLCECKNPDVQLIAARDFDQFARHLVRGDPDLQIDESCRVPVSLDFNKSQTRERTLQARMAKTRPGKPEPPFGF